MTLKLDENQQKAVEHFQGPALVVAGPGSGKTTVIKERILNLIQSHNVNPEQILAIAFTNAAADEMEKRFLGEPTLKDSKPEICKKQIQDLRPDTLEPDIVSYPPIGVNNRTQETSQVPEDFLKKQIQDIKPETSKPENSDNVTQVPTLERGVDRETPVESTALTLSDSSTGMDSDTHPIHGQNSSENEVEDPKKSIRYYLRRGGRFAVEKIKTTILKKPNS